MFLLFAALKVHDEDTALLETWYMKDTNVLPAMYRLQPISSILHHYNDKASFWICLGVVDLKSCCICCHIESLVGEVSLDNFGRKHCQWVVLAGALEPLLIGSVDFVV